MQSYTGMSDEAISATIDAQRTGPEHTYQMELSSDDLANLLWALRDAWDFSQEDAVREWAYSFASNIAETLGIEFV